MYCYYVAPEHNDENDGEAKDFSQAIEAQQDDDFKRVRPESGQHEIRSGKK